MITKLFVYGTLAPGRPNEHILAHLKGQWKDAWVYVSLCEKGWGATMGFPALIPSEHGSRVDGMVLSSRQLPGEWQRLDAFEGKAYERQLIKVFYADGAVDKAYIYALKDPA